MGQAVYRSGGIGDTRLTIRNCTITNNPMGILCDYNTKPELLNSNVCYNDYGVLNNYSAILVPAINNYWGDPTGPYHPLYNPTGLGDSASTYVDVIPFLSEPDTSAPPIPVQNLRILNAGLDFIEIAYDSSHIGDLAGYRVYFSADTFGFPFSDTVDVGLATSHTLANLVPDNYYTIAVTCYDGQHIESWYSNSVSYYLSSTAIDNKDNGIVSGYNLAQNYPNPFNAGTVIRFELPQLSQVTITVATVLGQEIAVLTDGYYSPGIHTIEWDASGLPSGIYFCLMQAGEFSAVKKMLLVK